MNNAFDSLIQNQRPAEASESNEKISNDDFVTLIKSNYGIYIKKCYSYLKCQKLAEDAVQEGILAAHCNLESVRNTASLGAWLNRIIVHKAIDSLHKNQKFPKSEENLEELVTYNQYGILNAPLWAEISNPEEEILKSEGLTHVKQAMETLADIYRIPILLKDFEGFSINEISELLEISPSNVKVRVHRGRIKLRNELSDYFFPSIKGGSK